jgi:hypothetical protein
VIKKIILSAGCTLALAAAYVSCANGTQSTDSKAEQQALKLNAAATPYVLFNSKAGAFTLAKDGKSAKILVDSDDWPGVLLAAKDLGTDIGRVTGKESDVVTDASKIEAGAVVVGTIGKSKLIDGLIEAKKIDVSKIKGQWESFLIQTVDGNLVVAGSDKRGTIFGIYDISEKIGVSPWYWWADVPAKKHDALYIASGTFVQGPPKVKFRGIFINDEEPSFGNWSRANFGGINSKMYAHMFELILRLKGNYLWPAMWGKAFNEDDPLNPVVADEYGVIMGTSHHEPLMRNQEEWTKRSRQLGAWNYRENGENMRKFWLEGLKRNAKFDNLPTVGLRGDGDLPLDPNAQFDSNVEMLHQLFQDQRELIREAYGRDPATVPQMWVVFNEIWTFYNRGVRPPEDVIITFSDSNFGYLLELPREDARKHPDQLGLYYHIDMNGGPWNDRWISTREIPQIWQQLYLAYQYGIHGLWIVNVGDLKPKEAEIDFFLDYAWNPDKIPFDNLDQWLVNWCSKAFPTEYAKECADLISRYIQLNHIRKPEIQQTRIWSAVNYNEADNFASEWQKIADRAEALKSKMPKEYADAYYQLVYYPVVAGAGTAQIYTELAKADQFAKQGRASASDSLKKAQDLFEKDKQLSDYYNSAEMASGKWKNMMSDKHIGYTQWSMPSNNSLPRISQMPTPAAEPALGVVVEGNEKAAPHQVESLVLPEFDSMSDQKYPITLFNRSRNGSIQCHLRATTPSVKLSREDVMVEGSKDEVVYVSIDWNHVPTGSAATNFTITSEGMKPVSVTVKTKKQDAPKLPNQEYRYYGSLSDAIVIPAAGFTKKTGANGVNWESISGMGRWDGFGDMAIIPALTPSVLPPDAAPTLEYNVYIAEPGKVTVDVEILPIFPDNPTSGVLNIRELRIGTAFDNEPVQVTDTLSRQFKRLNNEVFENVRKVRVTHDVKEAGLHTFKVVMVDPAAAVERIVFYPERVRRSNLGAPFNVLLPRKDK